MNPGTPRNPDLLQRIVAWAAVALSTVPEIVWQETGHRVTWWLTAWESALLVGGALLIRVSPRLRPLTRFLLAIAALNVAWGFVAPAITSMNAFDTWAFHAGWGERFFVARTFTLAGVILGGLTLIGSGLTRRDLFLCVGNMSAPAQPIPFLGLRKPVPWTWFGLAAIFVFAFALAPFLYWTVHPNFGWAGRIVRFFPWLVALAALNAASEEFQFRCLLLGHLRNLFSPAENVLITAAFFGLGHFYGQPSGPIGVLMAGFAGWIWARSMIETRGWAWALIIHMLQDLVIFSFLVVGAGM